MNNGSYVFRATLSQVREVADCAELRCEVALPNSEEKTAAGYSVYPESGRYFMWQDRQTGGGGCRIVWCNDVAWISTHSGYAWADFSGDVADLLMMAGATLAEEVGWRANPHIYPQ